MIDWRSFIIHIHLYYKNKFLFLCFVLFFSQVLECLRRRSLSWKSHHWDVKILVSVRVTQAEFIIFEAMRLNKVSSVRMLAECEFLKRDQQDSLEESINSIPLDFKNGRSYVSITYECLVPWYAEYWLTQY